MHTCLCTTVGTNKCVPSAVTRTFVKVCCSPACFKAKDCKIWAGARRQKKCPAVCACVRMCPNMCGFVAPVASSGCFHICYLKHLKIKMNGLMLLTHDFILFLPVWCVCLLIAVIATSPQNTHTHAHTHICLMQTPNQKLCKLAALPYKDCCSLQHMKQDFFKK